MCVRVYVHGSCVSVHPCCLGTVRKFPHLPKYGQARLGEGVLTLPVSKNVKMKKKKRKTKRRRKRQRMRTPWTRCWVETSTFFHERRARFNHGSYSHVSVWRAGSRSMGSVPANTGKSKQANKTTPTRHLPVLPNAFDIDFTWGLPLSFPIFLETQVHRATVTSSRRAGVFNEGRAAGPDLEKKVEYQGLAIASRREAVTRFVTDLEMGEELARHFETLSLTWRRSTGGTASKNE